MTEKNKADLTRCAEEILLARETYFPATIADDISTDLREAHERNDEVLERVISVVASAAIRSSWKSCSSFSVSTKKAVARGKAKGAV